MKARPYFVIAFSCLILLFLLACSDEGIISSPSEQLSGERISFGVSKDVSPWKPDSRALQQTDFLTLPCISNDETFGMSVVVKDKVVPPSRGTQFTSTDTLKAFDVAAYYYEEDNSDTELFFNEKVNDGIHTTGKTHYWPRGGKLDFIAFAPQDALSLPTAESYNNTVSIPYTITTEEQNHKDIMVASAYGLSKEGMAGFPVSLSFKHLLASVRFVVGDMQFIKINSLAIKNVLCGDITFTYNKETNTWTSSAPTTKANFTPDFVDTSGLPKGSDIAGNTNNATLFMAPQTLPDDAVIEVTYTELLTGEEGSGYANIGGSTWKAGKDYSYAFNIGTKFDVTIPTPKNQDAHYIMLEMPYELGELSSYVSSIKATARFWEDGNNTSSKSGISLKFKKDLSYTQKLGLWTDEQWVQTKTIDGNDNVEYSDITKHNIRGNAELLNISVGTDTIVLFIEENNGITNRNGELVLEATLNNGSTITIGQGNFKQLCPGWNDVGIGVERIEDGEMIHPYGFDYSRKVKFENPYNNYDPWWDIWGWAQALFQLLAGYGVEEALPNLDNAAEGFVSFETKQTLGITVVTSVILDYRVLNEVEIIANKESGIDNTKALYNYTGNIDINYVETQIQGSLGWTSQILNEGEKPLDYAAFVALTRNRMYESCVITSATNERNETESDTIYSAILHEDANGNDIIEWYLPSSTEAQQLKETGTAAQGISPLNGTYWSSTAGNDANAWAHSYTFSNNTFVSVNEQASRMTDYKVRAVRKK